jgi:CheY-like chemotaxis protein
MEQQSPSVRLSVRPGGGTRGEDPPATAAETATSSAHAIRPCTVLLVEDDALISMAVADLLNDLGHRVIEARSGRKALEILRAGTPIDLVMTDQVMPGMTGTQLAAEIRMSWPDLPVVIATGYPELPKEGGLELQRLDKPYGQEELTAVIARVMGARMASPPEPTSSRESARRS